MHVCKEQRVLRCIEYSYMIWMGSFLEKYILILALSSGQVWMQDGCKIFFYWANPGKDDSPIFLYNV